VNSVAACTQCAADIELDEFDVDRDDLLSCPDCGANLRVAVIAPVVLAPTDETEPLEEAGDDDGGDDDWD
jgi:lysine biosynthesis protein LysW